MSRGRVLIVTYHYPPEPTSGALRMAYLAKYLPECNWDPVVITRPAQFNGEGGHEGVIRVGNGEAMLEATASFVSHLPAQRVVGVVKARARDIVFFPDRAAWWIPQAVCAGIAAYRRQPFDVIVTSAMPASVHVVGWTLASILGRPWIADYRDLWTGNPYVVDSPWRANLLRALERRALRRAHRVTTITEALAGPLAKLHGSKVSVIPNTLDAEEWAGVPFTEPEGFRIVFAGSLYHGKRNPERLFAQIAALRERGDPAGRDARVDFYGPHPGNLLELAARYGLAEAVRYCGIVPRSTVMHAERAAALLLVILNDDQRTVSEYGSKIYEYHAAGRPVLGVGPPQSAVRQYIDDYKIGWFASSDEEIRDALRSAHQVYVEHTISRFAVRNGQTARSLALAFAEVLDCAGIRAGTA
jgi:hypothetical protein